MTRLWPVNSFCCCLTLKCCVAFFFKDIMNIQNKSYSLLYSQWVKCRKIKRILSMQSRGCINVSELNISHGICSGTSAEEKCKLSSVNFHLNG